MTVGRLTEGRADRVPAALIDALRRVDQETLDGTTKGLPSGNLKFGDIRDKGWNVLTGEIPLPLLVIKQVELEHNISTLQNYCDRHAVWLAPHGKTPMSPHIWALQLQAGAWAITVANVNQLQVCQQFGIPRVLLANQIIDDYEISYVGELLGDDSGPELYVLVDSREGLERLEHGLRRRAIRRPLYVLVELGMQDGRCGVRGTKELTNLAHAVTSTYPLIQLAGIEGYEGVAYGLARDEMERQKLADDYLKKLAAAARQIKPLVDKEPFIVSAGGSIYFDRVVKFLGKEAFPNAQLVIRSGGYVTHDSGLYKRSSPMSSDSVRFIEEGELYPAIEVWAPVISKPQVDLAILGVGGRDVPTDIDYPIPTLVSRDYTEIEELRAGHEIVKTNDQHAFMRLPASSTVNVGDLIGLEISHPCTAFDKWRVILLVDGQRNVVGAIRTYF